MAERTDEQLLKRARHGGQNLTALAILATIAASICLAVLWASPSRDALDLSVPFVLIAVSYWFLALAARRGNALAVSIVLGFLAVQFVLAVALQVLAQIRPMGAGPLSFVWILILLLIIVVLARNRTDLVDLRRRGLWGSLYGAARPSQWLCAVGGALMLVGFVTLYGAMVLSILRVAQTARARQDFVEMVSVDEKDFRDALSNASNAPDGEVLPLAIAKADKLGEKARAIMQRAPSASPMRPIASIYVEAVDKWRSGLVALRDEGSPNKQAQAALVEGDRLRQQAVKEFDDRFKPAAAKGDRR